MVAAISKSLKTEYLNKGNKLQDVIGFDNALKDLNKVKTKKNKHEGCFHCQPVTYCIFQLRV